MFKNKMETEAIPERVFLLCKNLENAPVEDSKLRDKMEPAFLASKSHYFQSYRNAAEELGLISISDKMIRLSVDKPVIKDMRSMRRYINSNIAKLSDGVFFKVTEAVFNMNENIMKLGSVSNLGPQMSEAIGMSVDAMSMRAWRFWVSYLGLGYMHDMTFLPNAQVFLWDLINNASFALGEMIPVSSFVSRLMPSLAVIVSETGKKEFNYGVTCGLRSLESRQLIRIHHVMDREDMWRMYNLEGFTDPVVTHISVEGGN